MSDLNQLTITGRLGADPEIRRTAEGKPIANLRVAVGEQWRDSGGERKERTEWVSVVIFSEGLAKVVEQHLRKGSRALFQGKIQTRKWQDQNGNDRYSTELVLSGFDSKMVMLDGPSGDSKPDQSGGDYGAASGKEASRPVAQPSFATDMDDDIPFAPEWRG